MITIMKTKTFLNALDDAYAKGVSAGANAEALKDREDQNRRLHDMYKRGKSAGYLEAYGTGVDDIEEIDGIEFDGLVDDMEAV
jgi:hypothetical protein